MHIIGLTGGIASGKSTVAKLLESHGAVIIDADQLAREVVALEEPAYNDIVAAFGKGILNEDRTINRTALGKIVFSDPEARRRLESITHPAIGKRAEERLAELKMAGTHVVIYMAPLLIEAGATSRVDEIWVVYVDREVQVKRVMERDNITREEALQKITAQMPMEEKQLYGSVVIDNRGSLDQLEKLVMELWETKVIPISNQG